MKIINMVFKGKFVKNFPLTFSARRCGLTAARICQEEMFVNFLSYFRDKKFTNQFSRFVKKITFSFFFKKTVDTNGIMVYTIIVPREQGSTPKGIITK